jgi:hypothetical protein
MLSPGPSLRCKEAVRYEPSAGLRGGILEREQQAQNERTEKRSLRGATARIGALASAALRELRHIATARLM